MKKSIVPLKLKRAPVKAKLSTAQTHGKQKSILSYFNKSIEEGDDKKIAKSPQGIKVAVEVKMPIQHNTEQTSSSTPPTKKVKLSSPEIAEGTVQALTPEQKALIEQKALHAKLRRMSNILPILDANIGITWFTALEEEFRMDYFRRLNDYVQRERTRATIYPSAPNVWEWTKQYPIQDVKVVILGQDPYHGPNQAHGLCFSVEKQIRIPPSLVNMYKELQEDIPGFQPPNHGNLLGWAQQGVLLLNAVLTVEASKANSHKDQGWERFTDAVIGWISRNLNSVVFLLWGSYAQKKAVIVDRTRHHLLIGPHPSPLSAHRGFFGCKHFSKCNELLVNAGRSPIDWNHLP